MTRREPVWRRALRLVRPDPARDVDDEFAFHMARREEDYRALGATPEQARQMTRERFGDVDAARDECVRVDARIHRSARRVLFLEELGQDLSFALRALRRRPGFAAAAIATLALGIGATTGIFTVINAVLLQPPPVVRHPEQLVALFTSDYSGPAYGGSSHPDYESFRDAGDVFAGLYTHQRQSYSVLLRGTTQLREVEIVSGNYFDVLGVPTELGRAFTPAEDGDPGAHPVAIISDRLWRSAADADPGVLGQLLKVNGQEFSVIGVAAPGFMGSERGEIADLWLSRSMLDALEPGSHDLTARDNRGIHVAGRLKPGVSVAEAQARMTVVAGRLFSAYPEAWRDVNGAGRRITVLAEKDARVPPDAKGRIVAWFGLLMTAVTLLLLLCGANVTTLLLTRGIGRGREVAVRLSLGASRSRLIRQLLTENMVLALAGGLAGLWLSRQITRGLLAMLQAESGILDISLHAPVIVFALAVTAGSGLLVGLAPALRGTRADLQRDLKGDGTRVGTGRRRFALRDVLVASQVALSVVLLAGAGLVLRSLRSSQQADVGFDRHGLVIIAPQAMPGYDAARAREYYRLLGERVAALPGVTVALGAAVPLGGGVSRQGMRVEGYQPRPGEDMEFANNRTTPGYFRLMGIPLVAGRDFEPGDRAGAPGVAIVNETFARRYWPGVDPLGRQLRWPGREQLFTVVGVARDMTYGRVGEEPRPYFYLPYEQDPSSWMALHVRQAGGASAVMEAAGRLARELDPDVPVSVETMDERVARQLTAQRTAAALLSLLGGVGLLLAGTGLYGVLAFSVAQRSREFGIRLALGASAGRVQRMVVSEGVIVTGAGVVVGLIAAGAVTRLASRVLFGVSAVDPLTLAAVVVVLAAVAASAGWVPARRATAVNPADAIRQE